MTDLSDVVSELTGPSAWFDDQMTSWTAARDVGQDRMERDALSFISGAFPMRWKLALNPCRMGDCTEWH